MKPVEINGRIIDDDIAVVINRLNDELEKLKEANTNLTQQLQMLPTVLKQLDTLGQERAELKKQLKAVMEDRDSLLGMMSTGKT